MPMINIYEERDFEQAKEQDSPDKLSNPIPTSRYLIRASRNKGAIPSSAIYPDPKAVYTRGMGALNLRKVEQRVLRAIHRQKMFRGGDCIAAGVSGGKDSSLMLYVLSRLRNRIKGGFDLSAFRVLDPSSPCFLDADITGFEAWCRNLEIPCHVIRLTEATEKGNDSISACFLCARRRREALFKNVHARGIRILALAHTAFDLAVTALMNMFLHGKLETMPSVQTFFEKTLTVIRPFSMITEADVLKSIQNLGLPHLPPSCPVEVARTRTQFETMLRQILVSYPHAIANILRASTRWDEKSIRNFRRINENLPGMEFRSWPDNDVDAGA